MRLTARIPLVTILLLLTLSPALARRDTWRARPSESSDPEMAAIWDSIVSSDAGLLEGHPMGPVQIPVPGLRLSLEEGTVWIEPPVEGRSRGFFVTGSSSLSWTPSSPAEARMLELNLDLPEGLDLSLPWFYIWSATPSPLALAAANAERVEGPCPAAEDYARAKGALAFHGLGQVAEVLNAFGPSRGTVRVIFPAGKELLEYSYEPEMPEEIRLRRFGNVFGSDAFWWQTYCSQRKPGPGVDPRRPVIRQRDLERLQLADARAYRIRLDIDAPTGRARAQVELDLELSRPDVVALPMDLANTLEISSVRDGEGRPLPHLQWEWDAGETNHDNGLILRLPEGAAGGEPLSLVFEYEGPMFDTEIMSWSPLIDEDTWFPRLSYEVDGATFETSFSVPERADALAVGELVSSEDAGGRKQLTYRTSALEKHATIQFGIFRKATEEVEGLEIEAYVPGALTVGVAGKATAREVSHALQTLILLFGPMEGETLRVSTTTAGYGRGFRSLLLVPRIRYLGEANWEGQMFLAHEVAHQWFGHMVSPTDYFREAWISEGFAEFASLQYIRMRYGEDRAADVLRRYRKNLLDSGPHGVKEQIGPISMGTRLTVWKGRPDSAYSQVVYEKGAYVLEMVRGLFMMIKGGDEPFFEMMRDFVSASKGRRTCTEDFRLAVEKALGIPMDWFFDQWVYSTGVPQLQVSYRRTEDGYTFKVKQDPATEFQMLVPVTFHFGGKKTAGGVLKVKPGISETHIPMERTARSIEINANEEVLARVDLTTRN